MLPTFSSRWMIPRLPDFLRQYPEALARAPLLHLSTRPYAWEQWLGECGVPQSVPISHRFDQFSMLIEAVAAGLGVALIPKYFIEEELRSGKLACVFTQALNSDNSYYVVVPDEQCDNPAVAAFTQWVKRSVRD